VTLYIWLIFEGSYVPLDVKYRGFTMLCCPELQGDESNIHIWPISGSQYPLDVKYLELNIAVFNLS
jgi:hypothetical protein